MGIVHEYRPRVLSMHEQNMERASGFDERMRILLAWYERVCDGFEISTHLKNAMRDDLVQRLWQMSARKYSPFAVVDELRLALESYGLLPEATA